MPLRFRDLVRPGAETVPGLEAAIARASAAATDASARLETLLVERRAALLADDDARCDHLDEQIKGVTRDRDRAVEAGLALGERLAKARQAEDQAKRDAIHARGEAARQKAISTIRGPYLKAARTIVQAAAELEGCAVEIDAVNLALAQAGDPRRIADPDAEARPHRGPLALAPLFIPGGLRVPDPQDGAMYAWPPGQDVLSARYVPPQQRGVDRLVPPGVPREVVTMKRPADAA